MFFNTHRFCDTTHMKASHTVEQVIRESIPQLFQDHLMCAGVSEGSQGACQGDSGGPLMYQDDDRKYIQIATVRGGVGECGDRDYPGIFVRLDHPSIWNFIHSTVMTLSKRPTSKINLN
jgi:secreted trypsin-like serine protease